MTKKKSPNLAEAEVNAIRNPDLVERRRTQILDAALKLFLKKGYASTTIRDICAASGVNQASLYDYIANRQDILRRLLNRVWFQPGGQYLGDRMGGETEAELRAALKDHFRGQWTENRDGIMLAYRTVPHLDAEDRALLREREEQQTDALARYLKDRAGLADDDDRAKVIANLLVLTNAYGPLRDWVYRDIDMETALDTVVDAAMAMISTLDRKP